MIFGSVGLSVAGSSVCFVRSRDPRDGGNRPGAWPTNEGEVDMHKITRRPSRTVPRTLYEAGAVAAAMVPEPRLTELFRRQFREPRDEFGRGFRAYYVRTHRYG